MPIFMRRVRAAIALAMLSGADKTDRRGSKWSSASHIAFEPQSLGHIDLLHRLVERLALGSSWK